MYSIILFLNSGGSYTMHVVHNSEIAECAGYGGLAVIMGDFETEESARAYQNSEHGKSMVFGGLDFYQGFTVRMTALMYAS